MEWVTDNAAKFLAIPFAAAIIGAGVSFFLVYARLRWRGSRRATKNWSKNIELTGDKGLLKLGVKRVNPDTLTAEGDAASVYLQVFTAFHYEVVGGTRCCFLRSFVVEVYAFYQWRTEKGLGDNVMTQFASAPMPCLGLEERKDGNGVSYWVKIPVADMPISA